MSEVKQHVIKNTDGTISIGTTQDVSSILEDNVRQATSGANRHTGDQTWGRKVASIPFNLLNAWCKEWGCTLHQLNNDPQLKAKMFARLRDRDYLKLRTDTGQI